MPDIRHIVFDIGSVLIHYDPNLPYRRLIPDDAERQWFFANVCTHDWNVEQDAGRTWADAEAEAIARHPDHAENIRGFRRYWHEMVPHAYDDTVEIMDGLIDAGHDVTMLTNFSDDTFRQAQEEMFPFLNRPRGVTVSGRVKLIKPDVRIYDLHTQAFGLTPEATLFIDDNQKNVDAAKDYGWEAVLFSGAKKLKEDLAEFGVGG
ncbi:MAG: HAD family hydrolase [Rhizobiaceae bacterium]